MARSRTKIGRSTKLFELDQSAEVMRSVRTQMKNTNALVILSIAVVLLFIANAAHAANGSVTYTYDALGRISTASYDTGVFIIYTYDANGNRLSQAINVNSTTGTWGAFNWGAAFW